MAGEWQNGRLGDYILLQSGGTPSKSRPDYWSGDLPWVSAKDMKSYWIDDTEDHLSEVGANAATRVVEGGTTLLLVRGMTLHSDVPICRVRRRSAFNQDVKAVLPRAGTDPEFIPYLLLGNKTRLLSIVDSAGHGTGRINSDTLLDLPVNVPPLGGQRAIACILGSVDDKIELNRRMNRTLEEMARAIFKSWFIDFDPVRAKAAVRRQHPKWTDDQVSRAACPKLKPEIARLFPDSFENSELGEIPQWWRVRSLDEIARFLNGLALQRFPPEDGDSLPVIKIAQLRAGNTAGADRASARLNPDYIVRDGDILFSWSGSLECVLWAGGPGALNQHLFKVTSSEYPKWLCYFTVHQHLDEFRHIAASKATTMGHIQRHHLAAAKIVIPADANLLSAMDAVLDPMLESLWQREVMSRRLAAVRNALLPKLISGELRVPDAERIAARCA